MFSLAPLITLRQSLAYLESESTWLMMDSRISSASYNIQHTYKYKK